MDKPNHVLVSVDYTLIAGFFVVMLAIGVYFAGRVKDPKSYFGGSQQVPWWLSSISLWMTSFSAFAFVAHSSLAYQYGFVPVTFWWVAAACTILIARLIAARWRRVATTSPMEFIEERYGPALRQLLSWLGAALIILDDGTKVFALGAVIHGALGFPLYTAILTCGLTLLTYTLLGGLWAVLVADSVQFLVMLAAVVVLIPLSLGRVGGVEGFFQKLPEGFLSPVGGKYNWLYLLAFACLLLLTNSTRWSFVQRYYSVKSDRDARKVCYLFAALNMVVAPLLIFPALAASIYMPGVADPDLVYGLLCKELLPVGMLGLLVAAIFSATMSSLSSDYNAVASVLTIDVYKRLFAKNASDRAALIAGRIFTLVVGLVTVGVAVFITYLGEQADQRGEKLFLFDIMIVIFAVLGPPTMVPVAAGLLSRKVSNAGALCGAVTGTVITLSMRLLTMFIPSLTIPEWGFIFLGIFSTIGGVILGSALLPISDQERERTDRFLDGLLSKETRLGEKASRKDEQISPAYVIGIAQGTLGALLILAILLFRIPLRTGLISLVVGSCMVVMGIVLMALSKFGKSRASKTQVH